MQLFYDEIALHDLGTLFVSAQETHGEPEEAPQRLKHTLLIKIKSTHPGYADNLDAMNRVRAALKQQSGRLRWLDDNGTERLNWPVTVAPLNWPENPNEKGTYLQALEVTFFWYENIDKSQTNTEAATFQRSGTDTPVIALDTVERF